MLEDIMVELVAPAVNVGPSPVGGNVKSLRKAQVTSGAGTASVDGVTYTRTSPLRTYREPGGNGPALDSTNDAQHWQPAAPSAPSVGNALLAIFSQSGT